MSYLPLLAAAIIAILATLHLVYTLRDILSRPRYFVPRDRGLLPAMQATRIALAPHGRDFGSTMLGFHLSHGIGMLLFALLIVLTATTPLPQLKPLMIGLGLAMTLIAWRFWFHIPLAGCAAASAQMIAAWVS